MTDKTNLVDSNGSLIGSTSLNVSNDLKSGIVYDKELCLHVDQTCEHPENANRILGIMKDIKFYSYDIFLENIPVRETTDGEILTTHTSDYLNQFMKTQSMSKSINSG